jgi:hypothetical protein
VREGQRAVVSSPGLGCELGGVVERVGRRVFKNDVLHVDPRADTDLRVFEVRVRLDEPSLPARMIFHQVDVAIDVEDSP